MSAITYQSSAHDQRFLTELHRRVKLYFTSHTLSKSGTPYAKAKAVCLLTSYLVVYLIVLQVTSITTFYLCFSALGSMTISIALNVAHDAAHNTFCASKKWNDRLLYTFDFLGVSGYMWRLKHVHSHHLHVNIPEMDGDIKQSKLVRIFPNAPFLRLHCYQYIYMPFLYMLYTLFWFVIRDFKDFLDPDISGKPGFKIPNKAIVQLVLGKVFFISRMIVLPAVLLPFSLGEIMIGFLVFHLTASLTVAMALISTHIGETSVYPIPDEDGQLGHSWVRHQLMTTSDFAVDNPILTHFFGGFNHHVVHHLFPGVCHIHYPVLTQILRETCDQYDMPYKHSPSLASAMWSHFKFLRLRSRQEVAVDYIEM